MLRKWMTSFAAIVTIGFVAACAQQSEVGTTLEPGAEQPSMTWQALATGDSNVKAEIAIRDEDAGTFASIALDGEAGHTYPWHIHEGHCGSGGAIVGDAGAYTPVTTDAEGEGQATADLAIDLEWEANYYVNVHASPDDLGTIVACGEVETQ